MLLQGDRVVGLDNLNHYYDPTLKRGCDRSKLLFLLSLRFEQLSLEDGDGLMRLSLKKSRLLLLTWPLRLVFVTH